MSRQIKTMTEKMIEAAPRLTTSLIKDGLASDVFHDIIAIIEKRAKALSG